MVRKSLLALLCIMGLTVTPQAKCFVETAVTIAVVYEIISLFRTWTRDPKPDRKSRPLLDYSMNLYKSNSKEWRSNVYQNLWIIQEDRIEGQGYKDTYLKLKQGEKIKASKRKCYHFGMNGWLLFYLAFIGKTQKSIKDFALLTFAVVSLKGGVPKALAGNARFAKLFKYFGWENPYKGTKYGNEVTMTLTQFNNMSQWCRTEFLRVTTDY